ncbi:Ribonuclease H domain [Sesbania bispinosa]|nr:Ribonuclease H domain [Sesbania bispinosa]
METSAEKLPMDDVFKIIWSWQGPPRIYSFVWKAIQGRLLTNSERLRRGMTNSDLCLRCQSALETLIHLLRDCDVVAKLLESLIDQSNWSSFFSLGQDQWIRKNLEISNHKAAGVAWSFIFPIGIWSLWKDRNSLVFKQKIELPGNLFFHIISYTKRVIEVVASPNPIAHRVYKKEELVSWTKPPFNFYKLNVDGSAMASNMQASCGGLIRDHNDTFVKGFSCKIDISSTVKAELWGLLHGLNLACSLNLTNLIINVDSLLVVHLVKGTCQCSHHCYSLIRSIRKILSENSAYVLSHAFRESNRSVDHLAELGHT